MEAVVSAGGGLDKETLYHLAASAESYSEHPLGKAIAGSYAREGKPPFAPVEAFEMIPGRGVSALVSGRRVLAGNAELLAEAAIAVPDDREMRGYVERGCSITHLVVDGAYAGYIVLSDALRPQSAAMIGGLSRWGSRRCCSRAITKAPPKILPPKWASSGCAPSACRRTSWPISTPASKRAIRCA